MPHPTNRICAHARQVGRLLAVAALVLSSVGALASPAQAATGRQLVVSTAGSDDAAGTATAPWRTIQHAFDQLEPGDTLTVRGGTYAERVTMSYDGITPGTADAPITVQAAPGERPVIQGRLRLSGASHWTLRGINVTWSNANAANEHMVVFRGGTGWRFTGAEVWGARSYAGILVGDGARAFSLDHLHVHDTYESNGLNQDHLIYVDNGHGGSGVIERNVLAHSPNGRGVKLGPGSLSKPGTNNIAVRYNTFFANTGPSNVQLSGSSSGNEIHHNILVRPAGGSRNITAWNLTGSGNRAHDNLVWESAGAIDPAITDAGGNTAADPGFANAAHGDYRPTNPAAAGHGAHATGGGTSGGDGPLSPRALIVSSPAETDAFVQALTQDFLGRRATEAQLERWRRLVGAGASRSQVVREFAYSAEWVGAVVDGYYRSTLGRPADSAGRTYWSQLIRSGAAPAQVAAHFYGSSEYFGRVGGTDRAWVADLYEKILRRAADASGLGYWAGLTGAGTPRPTVAHAFQQSSESRRTRVQTLYGKLLGRPADAAGLTHWGRTLANGRDVDLAVDLASSAEYFQRAQHRAG